jgi:glycine/serine hydroxymethyltransferase
VLLQLGYLNEYHSLRKVSLDPTTRGFDETAFEEVAKIISLVLKDPENEKALAEGKRNCIFITSYSNCI